MRRLLLALSITLGLLSGCSESGGPTESRSIAPTLGPKSALSVPSSRDVRIPSESPSGLPTLKSPSLSAPSRYLKTPEIRLPNSDSRLKIRTLRAPIQLPTSTFEWALEYRRTSLDLDQVEWSLIEESLIDSNLAPTLSRLNPQPNLPTLIPGSVALTPFAIPSAQLKGQLQLPPSEFRLRPRSPYCLPGHTSQNFVSFSAHDGLPLAPGVW